MWRERRGLTMAELGQRVGTEASQINKLEKGNRRLTAEWMGRLARALDCAPADLLMPDPAGLAAELGEAPPPPSPLAPPAGYAATGHMASGPRRTAAGHDVPTDAVTLTGAAPRDLPVFGAAVGGDDGAFDFNGAVNEYVARPRSWPVLPTAMRSMFRASMEPRYFAGELVHVNPNRPITAGCFVVVQIRTGDPHMPTRGLIKQFVRRTASRLCLRQFNPRADLDHDLASVLTVHRIVGASDYG
ncbi:XRE family transcriptional regulator [Tistrella bauzanensis]